MKIKKFDIIADYKLLDLIKNKIKWDKRVSISDLVITSKNGHITVVGMVDSSYRKKAIFEIISSIEGVFKVDNLVTVPSEFQRSDSRIKSLICEQLSLTRLGLNESISVEVNNGCVKLFGTVYDSRKKAQAAGIVWELSGVNDCMNMIQVKGAPPTPSIFGVTRKNFTYLGAEVLERLATTVH